MHGSRRWLGAGRVDTHNLAGLLPDAVGGPSCKQHLPGVERTISLVQTLTFATTLVLCAW